MGNKTCSVCGKALVPGQARVSSFKKDIRNETYDRGAFHLSHLIDLFNKEDSNGS